MITCTYIYFKCIPAFGRRYDGYFLKYRLHCWSLEHVFDATREGKNEKVNRNGSYTSAVKYIIWHSRLFGPISKDHSIPGNLPSKVRLRVAVENDCSYRVEENETFELIKISSSPWSRSIGCFRDISFCLRGSLGEERNNKRTTHRTRISPSLFFLR